MRARLAGIRIGDDSNRPIRVLDVDETYVPVCEVEDVPDLRPLPVEVEGRRLLICKSSESLFAVDEICPHENRSMRYGVVQRGMIICPHHRYKFELETGRCRHRCPPATVFDVEVEEGTVYVRAPWRE